MPFSRMVTQVAFLHIYSLLKTFTTMKKNLATEIAEAIAAGAIAQPDNKFVDKDGNPIKVRSMESTYDPLQVGDVLTIPQDYKVLLVKFSDDADAQAYPCIYCPLKEADGSERNFRFFPNSLVKTIIPIVEGKRQAKVKTTGTATDLYYGVATVDEGLALLRGKSIKVTAASVHTVRDYTTKELRDTHIYQYDLVP